MPLKSATAPKNSYRFLASERIVQTAVAVKGRVQDRFPRAGLNRIAREIEIVSLETAQRAHWCASPQWQLRGPAIALTISAVAGVLYCLTQVHFKLGTSTISQTLQDVYNILNDTILFGVGLVFLWGWERRIKRDRALKALHELRSLAHIVDMHQLTKDHVSLFADAGGAAEKGLMTGRDLIRYLVFCGDLLALLGKIAALYAQELEDGTVLNAVTEIENLAALITQKIWQRITLVERDLERAPLENAAQSSSLRWIDPRAPLCDLPVSRRE